MSAKMHVTASPSGVAVGAVSLCGTVKIEKGNIARVLMMHTSCGPVAIHDTSRRVAAEVCVRCERSLDAVALAVGAGPVHAADCSDHVA